MKAGWTNESLIELCDEFTDGNWVESKDQSLEGIRLVQTGNVGVGKFKDRRDKARFINQKTFDRLKCFEVLPGDCLVSRLPDPVGRACEIPDTGDKMITAVDCSIVRTNQSKLLRDYFIYYSQSKEYLSDVESVCSGTTRKRISRKNLGKIQLPVPPLEEQKRIVAILDEAFEGLDRARAHTEANLQNAKELFESATLDAFRYASGNAKLKKFEEVASIESVLIDPREDQYLDIQHLGAGNMITGTDELVSIKTSREEKLKSGKFPFDTKMVLYSKIRPYLRKVCRPKFDGICSADVYPLLPREGVLNKDYLFHLLLGPDFTEYAIKGSDRVGMPKVNRKHLFSYEFPLPNIEAQTACAKKLDELMLETKKLNEVYESKLADLDNLRQSLLQKAFAGELT